MSTLIKLCAYAGVRELIAEKGIKRAFELAKLQGYSGVELLYIDSECKELSEKTSGIKAAIQESGIGVTCISCFTDVVTKAEPYLPIDTSIAAVKACIDLAESIACPYVHHTLVTRLSGDNGAFSQIFPAAIASAEEIAEYASAHGVTVLYEPQGMIFNGLGGYSLLLDTMLRRHSNVGLCLDVGNTLWVDEDCYAIAEKYAHHVKHVHVKDYVLDSDDKTYHTLGGRSIEEVALGKGIIDLRRVFDILTHADYNGYISVEDNSGSDFATTAKNAMEVIKALI